MLNFARLHASPLPPWSPPAEPEAEAPAGAADVAEGDGPETAEEELPADEAAAAAPEPVEAVPADGALAAQHNLTIMNRLMCDLRERIMNDEI